MCSKREEMSGRLRGKTFTSFFHMMATPRFPGKSESREKQRGREGRTRTAGRARATAAAAEAGLERRSAPRSSGRAELS